MDILSIQKIWLMKYTMKKSNNCDHKNFLQMYMVMNKRQIWWRAGAFYICSKCKKSCHASRNHNKNITRTFSQKVSSCLLWSLPAILLVWWLIMYHWGLYFWTRNYSINQVIYPVIIAILLITIFHIFAMYGLMQSKRLIIQSEEE